MFERTQPSVQRSSSEWFGVWQPIEPLATGGSVELWRATRESGGSALLRLYPRFQRQDTWRRFKTVAARRAQIPGHSQLVAVDRVGSYGRPHLLLDDPVGEPLATRIEREPLSPTVALRVFEDVATALDALARAGVPPLELSPADVFIAGDRGLLLADVGTLGEVLRGRCLNTDHAAPERVAVAQRGDGRLARLLARLSPWHAPRPTTATMGYSFGSVLRAALVGPAEASAGANALPARAQRVLDRTLAPRYRRRHSSPARIVKALQTALASPEPQRVPSSAAAELRSRRIGGRVAALAAGCVLAAAAAGAVTGVATTAPDPPDPAAIARDGVSVQAPAGWRAVDPADAPFSAGANALVVQSAASADVGLTVTRSGQAVLASVQGDEPGAVELRGGDAWHYREARVGGQRMDAYVLDTGAGPIVAACHGPATAAAALATCNGIVSTLRVRNVQAVPLGGAADARAKLSDTLAELDRSRARGRERLAAAATRPAQAAAAAGLARAYADSRDAATGTAVGAPGAQARLITELAATSRAYSALAAAARGGDAAGYRTASALIAERERALAGAIAALAPVGE